MIDWTAASSEERATAALAVLPTHFDDSNGVTARDVAHRLGLTQANQVSGTLRSLAQSGAAHSHFDKGNRRRRVYWRTAS